MNAATQMETTVARKAEVASKILENELRLPARMARRPMAMPITRAVIISGTPPPKNLAPPPRGQAVREGGQKRAVTPGSPIDLAEPRRALGRGELIAVNPVRDLVQEPESLQVQGAGVEPRHDAAILGDLAERGEHRRRKREELGLEPQLPGEGGQDILHVVPGRPVGMQRPGQAHDEGNLLVFVFVLVGAVDMGDA